MASDVDITDDDGGIHIQRDVTNTRRRGRPKLPPGKLLTPLSVRVSGDDMTKLYAEYSQHAEGGARVRFSVWVRHRLLTGL